MTIVRLDNEVYFKKAFTDPVVFRAFVKDILGIEVDPPLIETEKSFSPRVGDVAFKYDIFADDPVNRVIVEIQKVEYDHNFDRFLHYHLQGITEQQRTSSDYTVDRTVYTIVVMTAPYRLNKTTGRVIQDEVLISNLNPRTLKGAERDLYGHQLVFLNPNYKDSETPQNFRDWLDLIYESIHNPTHPNINLQTLGVKRAAELVEDDNITPQERADSKFEVMHRTVLTLEKEEGIEIGKEMGERKKLVQLVISMKKNSLPNDTIAQIAGIRVEEVEQILAENATDLL